MYRFRVIRESDRPALQKLLNKYQDVPLKWRNKYVLNHYASGVHVVTWYNNIVGMVHIAMVGDTEAWLESAYLSPSHRGHGVGTAFAKYQLHQAKLRGAQTVRVATGYNNRRVQHVMINKLRFARLSTWYRVKIVANQPLSFGNSASVKLIDHSKTGECWSYVHQNAEFRRSGKIITSPRDNCWWNYLDYRVLEKTLADIQSVVYTNQEQLKGLLLVKKSKGLNFNCPVVLQAYYSSNKVYAQLIKRLLVNNTTLYLSVSQNPKNMLAHLKNTGIIKKYSINRWVVMEREVL